MHIRAILSLYLMILIACSCQQPEQASAQEAPPKTGYDSTLAAKFGADEYGMKPYVLAFLKRGPHRSQDSATAAALQTAHLENIGRMAEAGKLVLAGPFLDTGNIRGIYIFNVATVEEARALTETDPAIQAGSLVMELKPWYGSAGLMGVNEAHERLTKKEITDH